MPSSTLTRLACAALLLAAAAVQAQGFPDRPLRLVTPFSAGGPGDATARQLADGLSKRLGQPVIVDNKPGAGGIIGADMVAKAPPDGYTLLAGANGAIINPLIRAKTPYTGSDLVPVSGVSEAASLILVDPRLKVTSLKELQALARSQPQPLFFATTGIGSTSHFSGEMIKAALGVPLSFVNYKSGGESDAALLAGQVQLLSEVPTSQLAGLTDAGKVRPLAVAGTHRNPGFPKVPTTSEAGFPDIRMTHWLGIFAPKGTPDAVLDRLNTEIQAVISSTAFRASLLQQNAEPTLGKRADFSRQIAQEQQRLGKIATELKIVAE
ncbi:MAG: Tripartite-type tricarboxylate transporter, receptor component TctC [Ramlibacter sp.]|nr:Tripartite-type tricarboxylate transporter, receptor component TctC [Ramlibacter sp.]